jgi:hypothetical protein
MSHYYDIKKPDKNQSYDVKVTDKSHRYNINVSYDVRVIIMT